MSTAAALITAAVAAAAAVIVAVVKWAAERPEAEATASETNARAAASLVGPLTARIETLEAKCVMFEGIIEDLRNHVARLESGEP